MIVVHNVHVTLEGTEVLHGVTFQVGRGQVAGYVGPNGAGKTTTMRLLTGALRADSGEVLVAGIDVAENPTEAKRRFGYVPEHGHLFESFTPEEYLAFVGRMHGLEEDLLGHRSDALLRFWGLDDIARQPMTGFSKGMKQKVLIAAALVHDPAVLLLDEPLNGLDAHAVLQMRALLRALAGAGRTVFYSSHLLDAVERVVDQVIILREGRVVRAGAPADIVAGAGSDSLEEAFAMLTETADAEVQAATLMEEAFG
jgi:ABC-2 type transport system ATP-binding protein